MRRIAILALNLSTIMFSGIANAETLQQPNIYQQSYAVYALFHPEKKLSDQQNFIKEYTQDYSSLFKYQTKVNIQQFLNFEQQRLEPILQQRREMSLKQAHVRFNILDSNKDQKLTLKEFQEIGLKTFNTNDKNQDGLINTQDSELETAHNQATHDGFKFKLPISMPTPNNVKEFIAQYSENNNYVTLGRYLSVRDKQFFETDTNTDHWVSEKEYVDEFMTRFDQNITDGKVEMKALAAQQFKIMSATQTSIKAKDIQKFAQNVQKNSN